MDLVARSRPDCLKIYLISSDITFLFNLLPILKVCEMTSSSRHIIKMKSKTGIETDLSQS